MRERRVVCWQSVVLGCLVSIAISGCSQGPGSSTTVKGKVTVDGQPAADHTVTFHNMGSVAAEYRTFEAKTNSSGDYEILKIYPGQYDVMVLGPMGGAGDDPGKAQAVPSGTLIPASGTDNSLKATVANEPLTFNCDMKKA